MMMTCNSEIQHPSPSDGSSKASFDDHNQRESGLDAVLHGSDVPSQIQILEPESMSSKVSQELKQNEFMQHFFTEALARSGQRANVKGDRKPPFSAEIEPQTTALPSDDNHAKRSGAKTSGLDLLGSLALIDTNAKIGPEQLPEAPPASLSAQMPPGPLDKTVKEWVALETAAKIKKEERIYVDKVLEWDVLCGRGGKSNHWSGNKRYRQVVSEMKAMYKHQDDKSAKTDLSRAIVDYVCNYGGRFLKKEGVSNSYYVLTRAEARKKTSQALRETKEPKWTL